MAANLTRLTFVLQTNMEKESTYLDHNHVEFLDFHCDSHTDGWSLVEGVYPTLVVNPKVLYSEDLKILILLTQHGYPYKDVHGWAI